jgi:uncharacterized integral membrane protein
MGFIILFYFYRIMRAGLILLILIAVLFGIFAIQNPSQAAFQLIFWKVNMPPVVIWLASFMAGALLVAVWVLPAIWKKKKEIRRLEEEIEGLRAANQEEEIHPEGPELGGDNFKSFFHD